MRGRVRGCAKSPFFFFISLLTCFAPLSLSLSSPVCACMLFFFSPPHGAESPWLPGSPGTDDSFVHSQCVWKICGCVGVGVFKGIVFGTT